MRTYLFFSAALRYLGIGLAVVAIAAAIWIYGPDRYSPATGQFYDGLGRELHESVLMPLRERGPGLLWEVVDLVAAIMIVGGISGIFSFSRSLRKKVLQRDRQGKNGVSAR